MAADTPRLDTPATQVSLVFPHWQSFQVLPAFPQDSPSCVLWLGGGNDKQGGGGAAAGGRYTALVLCFLV